MSDLGIEHLIQIAFHCHPSYCSHKEFPGLPAPLGSALDYSSFVEVKEPGQGGWSAQVPQAPRWG